MSSVQPHRTLFVVPSLKAAGAERQVVDLVCGLDPARIQGQVYFYQQPDALKAQLDTSGIPVHFCEKRNRFDLKLAHHLANRIDESHIELVHCTLQNALMFGWLARRLVAGPKPLLVVALHTTINVDLTNELADRWLTRRFLRSTDDIWFVCMNQAEHWYRRFPELKTRSRVIYNGVDTEFYSRGPFMDSARALREELELRPDHPIVACIAGFRPEKRHDLLLEAFSEVVNRAPEARLVLAGDGPEREAILAQAASLGISDKIRMTGVLADVRPLLAAASCKVLASTAVETFSMAMLEALSMEVPVVATAIGGASEAVIPGETGFLAEPGEVDDLVQGMLNVLDKEKATGMGRAGRDLVRAKFTQDAMVLHATEAMTDLISKHGGTRGA